MKSAIDDLAGDCMTYDEIGAAVASISAFSVPSVSLFGPAIVLVAMSTMITPLWLRLVCISERYLINRLLR